MGNKKDLITWSSELTEEAVEFTHPEIMLKLIATIDKRGWPHLTIISSNKALTKDQVVWGQFSRGQSKLNILENPKHGIFFMTGDMPFKFLQIKADYSHSKTEGEDIEYFNNMKLMRYLTYYNVYKVYYTKVVAASKVRKLPLGGIALGLIKNLIGKGGTKSKLEENRLNVIGFKIFKGPFNPKFLTYIDPADGYPVIIPCIQLTAPDRNRLVFPPSALKADLESIPENSTVAVLGMNMDLANQQVKGTFMGYKKYRGVKLGVIDIEEIYNSSPPLAGVYYPKLAVRQKVTDFHL